MEAAEKFFEENPEAQECHVALGIAKATREEAEALMGGVNGAAVHSFTREQEEPSYADEGKKLEAKIEELEKAETAAHAAYEAEKSPEAMEAWKQAQEALNNAYADLEAWEKKQS